MAPGNSKRSLHVSREKEEEMGGGEDRETEGGKLMEDVWKHAGKRVLQYSCMYIWTCFQN